MIKDPVLERYKNIKRLRKEGNTLQQIGELYGLTRERVRQILSQPYKPFTKSETHPAFIGKPKWLREGRERTRELVRYRDKYTCQSCKKKWEDGHRRFDVHHLNGQCGQKSIGYDKVADMSGLITLCHKCHFNHPEHSLKTKTQNYISPQTIRKNSKLKGTTNKIITEKILLQRKKKKERQKNADNFYICYLYENGIPVTKIAKKYGVSRMRIYQIIEERKKKLSTFVK